MNRTREKERPERRLAELVRELVKQRSLSFQEREGRARIRVGGKGLYTGAVDSVNTINVLIIETKQSRRELWEN